MVKKKSILKDALREISLNKKKFISLLLIIVIGTGFYVGLKSTPKDMKETAKAYYKETNLFDLKVVSSSGFSKNDYYSLKQVDGVKGVFLSKTLDVITTINNSDYVIKLNSINEDRDLKSDDYINHLTLLKGRYPKTINEGLVEEKFLTDNNLSLDDLVTLKPEDENGLRAKKIKIVGVVRSSYYSSKDRGTSNLKNGKVDYFMYLSEGDFASDLYTEGYITIKGANKYDTYSKKYDNFINKYKSLVNEEILKGAKETHKRNVSVLESDINELKDNLNRLNSTDLPSDELNTSIKEVSSELKAKEDELSKIKDVLAYSIKRSEVAGFYEYKLETERIENIAKVFPLMFFLVAALVSLTTMTRMVDEERSQMGTLRAIGYSKSSVIFKYILYALLASILGSIIGTILFYKLIPMLVGYCYNIFYDMPSINATMQINYALFSLVFSILSTVLATILVFLKDTSKTPAELMRPEAPKKGKRIFLEKIDKIWNSLSFLNKITLRNIFRYKKRLFMTVIGICGSTALILASFGIKDSVMKVADNQYNKIDKFDMIISINNNASNNDKKVLEEKILDENEIKKITYVYKSNVLLKNNKKSENSNIIVPENKEKINDYITLRQRKTKKDIKMDDDGIIVSEKLAKLLKLKKNSYAKLTLPNNKKVNVKVSDITENYIEHYVYISPKLYKKLSGENANYSTIIAITKNLSNKKEKALESNISDINNVTSTLLSSDTKNNYKDMMNTLNYVILILIVCAATLAFVVLYNLASVNISERRRELATIKVLGFYDEEVTKYIYKEMFILTIIGSLIGLILGSFLTLYVIKICETNLFMFTFNINFISYLLSFIITLLFLFIVNLFMHFELKKLDMVEALKSYE